jgi:hypothetical protein
MAKKHKIQPLSYENMLEQLPKRYRKNLTKEVVDEINKLIEDPDYGEEFKESIVTHTHILGGKENFSLKSYINAVKFYSLTAAGLSATKAYIKVFPERLQARLDRGQSAYDITGEASRFNHSEVVNKVRAQALVPLHLVNQGTVQKAINTLSDIMLNGKSEVARVNAANTIIKELRPPEVQQVELQLGQSEEALKAQERQTEQLAQIAENQRRLLAAGVSIEDVQQIQVTVIEAEEDE